MNIVGIAGSLRTASIHRALLVAAKEIAPANCTIDIAELHDIPLYNGDVETQQGIPKAVTDLAETIRAADAVIISAPEYNYSLSGVLKNALDWISRVPEQPFVDKTTAIIGASPGNVGTARMQYHLRQVLVFFNAKTLNKPEMLVPRYSQLFDADLRLVDNDTRERLKSFLAAVIAAAEANQS